MNKGHSKKCLARALICAVENARDDESVSAADLAVDAATGRFYATSLDYYDGLLDCICEGE